MKKRFIVIPILAVVAVVAFLYIKGRMASQTANMAADVPTAMATVQDISSEISSSGTITPKNTYNITSLVSGDIVAADFEVGDMVEKDQVLYQIDVSSMESELNSVNNSLTRANANYSTATQDYAKASADFGGNLYRSSRTGYIKELPIQAGDKVSGGGKLATIYNDKTMRVRIPFLSAEAGMIPVGTAGTLTLTESREELPGRVVAVGNMEETLDGGRLVKNVTFEVDNPGGLTTKMSATAAVGEFSSSGEGTFEAATNVEMQADLKETVEVEKLLVNVGDYVAVGTPIFKMTSDSAAKLLKSYKDAVDTAQGEVDAAKKGVDTTRKNYEEYTIKAPISGKVISKNYKQGDKVGSGGGNNNQATNMAVIYDMSSYTFKMSVDEKDISKVQEGQKVRIKSDAFPDSDMGGTVTSVSLESTTQNGVSTYPVTVTLDENYSLLPGMNVDGYITLESASNALTIPAAALMRGNKVYVKDTQAQGAAGKSPGAADATGAGGAGTDNALIPAGFKEVTVTTGVINADFVQITSGLKEGDEVYLDIDTQTSESSGAVEGAEYQDAGGGGGEAVAE